MRTVDVYADILFLINLGMDALCLMMTARCLHRPMSLWRLLAAASVGGIYGVAVLFLTLSPLLSIAVDVGICVLMCLISLGPRRLWLTGGWYLLTSMVMGGVMTALYHWLNGAGVGALLPRGEEGVTSVAFVLLAGVGWLLTLLWGRIFRQSKEEQSARVTLLLRLGDRHLTVTGMVDSGNLLEDPLSGVPVIVVRASVAERLFPSELRVLFKTPPKATAGYESLAEAHRIRLIPTATATGQSLLWGIRLDEIRLCREGEKHLGQVRALICPAELEGAPADALIPVCLLT